MNLKLVPSLIALLGAGVIAYGLWQLRQDPPRVTATGSFQFTDALGTTLVFPKRTVARAGFETTEVQLPGGTWIDCRADCAHAIRTEYSAIWESQQLRQR